MCLSCPIYHRSVGNRSQNDIFLLIKHDARLLRKHLLNRIRDGVHQILAVIHLDQRLLKPVVTDELALAITDFNAGKAVSLPAVELLNILLVVVADVLAERALLVELGLLPLAAVGVARVVRALVPGLQDGHDLLVVLDDHEACVGVCAVEAVAVELRLLGRPGVLGHDEGVVRLDVPVVHHPLHGQLHEAEGRVGVEEDDEFVVLDQIRERRRLDPGGVAVLEFGRVHEFVVVAVDLGVGVMGEDAAGHVIDVAPVVLALLEHLGALERAGVEIENEDVTAHLLGVARVFGKHDLGAIGLADEGLRGRDFKRLVENAQDVVDVRRLCVAEGPVSARQQLRLARGLCGRSYQGPRKAQDMSGLVFFSRTFQRASSRCCVGKVSARASTRP